MKMDQFGPKRQMLLGNTINVDAGQGGKKPANFKTGGSSCAPKYKKGGKATKK